MKHGKKSLPLKKEKKKISFIIIFFKRSIKKSDYSKQIIIKAT